MHPPRTHLRRRIPFELPAAVLIAIVATARSIAGCSSPTGRAAETVLLHLGEAACEALPELVADKRPPWLGPLDALVCPMAEAAIAAALSAAAPKPAASPSLGGGGAAPPAPLAHRPLRVQGRVVALVRVAPERVALAQGWLDAHTGLAGDGGAEGGR